MDMRAIQMNEQLEPTAEESAVYEILDAMKPGDWFYLPDGASGADAVFVVAAGQSRGLNLVSQAERRFLVGGDALADHAATGWGCWQGPGHRS